MKHPKARFDEIDLLRGLSCLAVVAYHYFWRGQLDHWIVESPPTAVGVLSSVGYLGVHLFFMISGFVIFMSAEGATVRAFAASRVARLYPALWVAAPITAAAAWWTSSSFFQVDGRTLALNLTMLPHYAHAEFVDGAYWSLAVEIQFYAMIAVVIAMRFLQRIESLLIGWLVLSALNWLRPTYPLQFWLDVNWAPFFVAGIAAYRIRSQGLDPVRQGLYLVAWVLACAYTIREPHPGWDASSSSVGLVAFTEICLVTLFFSIFWRVARGQWQMQPSIWTTWAGRLTYPVYLLHQNIGYIGIDALNRQGIGLIPAGLLMLASIVAVSALICLYIEVPVGRWLRRTLAGTRPSLRTA